MESEAASLVSSRCIYWGGPSDPRSGGEGGRGPGWPVCGEWNSWQPNFIKRNNMSGGEPKYCTYCTTFYSVKRRGERGSKCLARGRREDTDTSCIWGKPLLSWKGKEMALTLAVAAVMREFLRGWDGNSGEGQVPPAGCHRTAWGVILSHTDEFALVKQCV